ncbi:MAG: hypothetical protein CR982_01785 [Candidatus Cloacimonadota bacterium]|nr:MAG: hypothetical protein CR982_01785 [Candidatus Cloacimonadota bacterium]PIE77453.1 MAG: hypothetical protein CSA15_12905 [Candidatus Delongbacteria bacterium]
MKKRTQILLLIIFSIASLMADSEKISLEDCHKLAIENNHELKAANSLLEATKFEKKAAFSNFLPSINFVGTYTLVSKKVSFDLPKFEDLPVYSQDPQGNPIQIGMVPLSKMGLPTEIEVGEKNNFLFNLSLTQPIYTGGKIQEGYRIREKLADISENKLKLTKSELLYRVDKYFWQAVSLSEKVKLVKEYIKMIDSHITDINNYIDEGILTKNYLLKAKIKKREAELNLLKAENGLHLTKMALNQAVGRDINREFTPDYDLDKISNSNIIGAKDSLKQVARRDREEIKILDNMKSIANSFRKIERSRFLPNLALNGGYSLMNPNPYNSMKDEFDGDYNISLVCNLEIFHFFERKNRYDAAKERLKAASENLLKAKEMIDLDINKQIYNISEASKKIEKAKEMLLQAEENLKETKDHFKEGIVNSSEVLDAQTLWQESFSEKIDAIIGYKLAMVELKKATGELGNLKQ